MKYFLTLSFVIVFFILPIKSNAQTIAGLQFGGFVGGSTPCTCMTPGFVHVQYTLLYPSLFPWITRALLLTPATVRFGYEQFLILPPPTAWHLGLFAPTPSACFIGVPPECPFLPTDGIIVYTGSSFPGFSL